MNDLDYGIRMSKRGKSLVKKKGECLLFFALTLLLMGI